MQPKRGASDRSFGYTFAAFFTLLGLFPLIRGDAPKIPHLCVALIMGLLGWLKPAWLHRPARLWIRFGELLQKVTQPIIMGVIFFLVFGLVGILMRIFGSDPLRRKWDKGTASYWQKRENSPDGESMRLQF